MHHPLASLPLVSQPLEVLTVPGFTNGRRAGGASLGTTRRVIMQHECHAARMLHLISETGRRTTRNDIIHQYEPLGWTRAGITALTAAN